MIIEKAVINNSNKEELNRPENENSACDKHYNSITIINEVFMKKIVLLVLFIFYLPFVVLSQNLEGINARVDAMGGVFSMDDPGWAIGSPSLMANVPDILHGSIFINAVPNLGEGDNIGETYGGILLVKSLGEIIRLGFTLNERRYMPVAFYESGSRFLNFGGEGASQLDSMIMVPSVSLAFKINDNINFGFGGFFKSFGYNGERKSSESYVAANGTDTLSVNYIHDELDKKIAVYGFVFDALLSFGGFQIRPSIMYGIPTIKGTEKTDFISKLESSLSSRPAASGTVFEGNTKDMKWESPNTRLLKGGAVFVIGSDNLKLNIGGFYQEKNYQFKWTGIKDSVNLDATGARTFEDKQTEVSSSERSERGIDYFIGLSPSFADNFIFHPEYDGGIGWMDGKQPGITADSSLFYMYHNLRLGVEKAIPDFWIFDNIFLRAGVVGFWSKAWQTIENSQTLNVDEDLPWSFNFYGVNHGRKQAKVSGGLGVKKGRGQFDVSVDFLQWKQGIIVGAPAAIASVSIDFGTNKEF